MGYEKTTWEDGDIITAEKLNNLENGVASAGGILIIHMEYDEDEEILTLDHTFSEIYNASESGIAFVKVVDEGSSYSYPRLQVIPILEIYQESQYMYVVPVNIEGGALYFIAESPDGYPVCLLNEQPQ